MSGHQPDAVDAAAQVLREVFQRHERGCDSELCEVGPALSRAVDALLDYGAAIRLARFLLDRGAHGLPSGTDKVQVAAALLEALAGPPSSGTDS